MKILFIGINPHYGSFRRRVPFSNNKMFWYLLSRAGLILETESQLKNDETLRTIYSSKFGNNYRLGFMNLIDRPTHDVTQLRSGEETPGRRRVRSAVRRYKPVVVCFIGKVTYQKYIASGDFDFGWQKDLESAKCFVMHFPIRGKADVRVKELRRVAAKAGIRLAR